VTSLILLSVGAVCAIGAIIYGFYGVARLDGDPQAQNGAIVLGVGGAMFILSGTTLMFPATAVMAAGALMSMNVVSSEWLGGDDSDGDGPERPALGWILILLSFPILAVGALPFWMNVVLLVAGGAIEPLVTFFGLGALMLGGWMFVSGFEMSGLRRGHPFLRGGVFAAAILCSSWFAIFVGQAVAHSALRRLTGS
jgi:hypothetical protein